MYHCDLSEIECTESAQNLAFVLSDDSLFFGTGYKVLRSQSEDYFVRCSRSRFNGKIKLVYFTKELTSFGSFLETADSSRAKRAILGVLKAVFSVQSNGFLSLGNVLWGLDTVFLDVATNNPQLVYLPVSLPRANRENLRAAQEFYRFCDDMLAACGCIDVSCGSVCKSPGYDAGDLNALRSLIEGSAFVEKASEARAMQGKGRLQSGGARFDTAALRLVAMPTAAHKPFAVDVPQGVTVLGKKQSEVDIVIDASTAISRVHCRLEFREGSLSVFDLGSANGTFVDGRRLRKGEGSRLSEGSHLRLADVEFVVEKAR